MSKFNQTLKLQLKQFKESLCDDFTQKASIISLTRRLVAYVDELMLELFHKNKLHKNNHFCLVALGSYGRRELQLHSDIDLLLLHEEDVAELDLQRAQSFIQDCWDIGLNISHQITTVAICSDLASQDLRVISTLLDMHLICGRGSLMDELRYHTHALNMWTATEFFYAKQLEQQQRYLKYGETAYNLEPNVKQGPGGLRDLQVLLTIGKRFFGIKKLADGILCHFITDKEYEEYIHCQHVLWRVRFALHILAGKQEERLLFDYQVKLAALFGFVDTPHSLAIEQFMKTYFKVIKRGRELNEMLLQWFSEFIDKQSEQVITPLDANFHLDNKFIEVRHPRVFIQNPTALIELFLWIAKYPDIEGIRSHTIRLLRQHLYLMGKRFRKSPSVTNTFMKIFREGKNPFLALQFMNKHGVLEHYLECFAAVTGQMQYDLFHVFTVDQHTLFVIRNLVRFLNPDFNKQFPLAANIMAGLENRSIIYLAALFHDIAKGRGGDHSELGAEEASEFAIRHHLSQEDSALLIWLVRNHLLMSHTAQRQDIYDPKTVVKFCSLLPDPSYLDYLYLLTVADICATNQTLWNSWKDSLLKELYHAAARTLQEKKSQVDDRALILIRQEEALSLLIQEKLDPEKVRGLWDHIKSKYFIHESAEVIARHTKAILTCQQYPLVLILPHHSQGGTEVFIYMPHRDDRFIVTTTVLSNHRVTIQEATILTCDNQFDLDTYVILDERHQAFLDDDRAAALQQALTKHLAKLQEVPVITKHRLSRAQAHFNVKPNITFADDLESNTTRMFLIATDKPGLLARVSRVFSSFLIHFLSANIVTAGERAEDTFYISTASGQPLSTDEKEALRGGLLRELA